MYQQFVAVYVSLSLSPLFLSIYLYIYIYIYIYIERDSACSHVHVVSLFFFGKELGTLECSGAASVLSGSPGRD